MSHCDCLVSGCARKYWDTRACWCYRTEGKQIQRRKIEICGIFVLLNSHILVQVAFTCLLISILEWHCLESISSKLRLTTFIEVITLINNRGVKITKFLHRNQIVQVTLLMVIII